MRTQHALATVLILLTIIYVSEPLAISMSGERNLSQQIDDITKAEAKYDLFSGAVLVAKNGEIVYGKGYGYANKEYQIPNTMESQFNISSIQKTFIATVVMQLYEEGKIDIEEPLKNYFPDCPYEKADQIQIKHLLNHTSGLGDYRRNEEYQANSENYTCIDDVLPLVYKQELAFDPGEGFRYSNAGVLYLKAIIEKIEKMKFAQVLDRRIFDPLEMDHSVLFREGDLLPHRATAYALRNDGETYRRILGEPSAYAGGGIYTNVLDLLKFDQALYGEELLNEKNKKIMFTPVEPSPNYAYGWEITRGGETTVIYHGGGSGGFSSTFRRYPEMGYTLVVLSNYIGAAFDLADKIENLLLGQSYSIATEADMFYRRAMHFQAQKDYLKAIDILQQNVEQRTPHLPSVYQSARSRILGEFEQEKAIELLDTYIAHANDETQPSIAAAWWRKGVACEQLGRTMLAIECYRTSLKLDPRFEYAQQALIRLAPDAQ
jgi:CubicO group peptidase (beta-lactamase class C family)